MNTRQKDANWAIRSLNGGSDGYATDTAQLAVLMDLRDELKTLNRLLGCHNAVDIPNILRRIEVNTRRPKKRRKVKK